VEADRLRELRLAAAEDRVDCLMHLGRYAEGVAEVEGLVRGSPTRERAVVLLMRALYGVGRQADALAAYHDLRRRLDDELAVDPAEPTQTMYQRILAQDPSLALPHARGNLPRRGTGFVGRGDETPLIASALTDRPLVTLTGVGGVGKSRLALQVATQLRPRFPDGVWVCELAHLSAGGPVGHAVAVALRVQQRHGLTIEQTLIEYLAHRKLLLVLDNCEHVLDAAAELIDQVVQHCPDVAVLATSRESLGIVGEQRWPVSPLAAADAHTLFLQRAQADRPGFRPDRHESDAIAEICLRVDGLPLGIELAAARMRAMSAEEIARRLGAGGLLSGGPRTAPPRHHSLAAAIDWSYQLLSKPEQRLFERLSVFAGGCDLAGAHEVCAEPGTNDGETLDLLTRLVDKSLVTVARLGGHSRYHVLETLRAHGRQLLLATGAGEQLGRRHAAYFTTLAERAAHGLQGADERSWVERVLPDYDNLRTAFELAAADQDTEVAVRLVTSLPELVHLRIGYESAGWSEQVLELVPPDHPLYPAAAG
jgi:predicted ATPase